MPLIWSKGPKVPLAEFLRVLLSDPCSIIDGPHSMYLMQQIGKDLIVLEIEKFHSNILSYKTILSVALNVHG